MNTIASKNAHFSQVKEFAFITGLLSSIEVILSMPMHEILKSMPLAAPIVDALENKEGTLGELLSITSHYITGQNDNLQNELERFELTSEFMQQELVNASKWCTSLGV